MRARGRFWAFGWACAAVLSASGAWAAGGESGWVIFKKAQPPTFRAVASSSAWDNPGGWLMNPASLGHTTMPELLFVSELGFAQDKFGGLALSLPSGTSRWGFMFLYYDAGSAELNWEDNGALSTETVAAQRDLLGSAVLAQPLGGGVSLGAGLKVARSVLADREAALAFALDVGLLGEWLPGWTWSAAVHNVGIATRFTQQAEKLPSNLYAGTAAQVKGSGFEVVPALGASYNWVDGTWKADVGLQAAYEIVFLHGGYTFNTAEANLQVGGGVRWRDLTVSYAYLPGTFFDPTHRLMVGYGFGAPEPAAKPVKAMTSPWVYPAAPAGGGGAWPKSKPAVSPAGPRDSQAKPAEIRTPAKPSKMKPKAAKNKSKSKHKVAKPKAKKKKR